ncbi:hypothetical protein Clacol_006188 [Clathrus columnatus]|uniref:Uncharacterized protein n=1 Tax=Clathrus columnatus TaxID=1419009 RepID=A0AAV5AJ21_9AGAM|nr:hypothetical protein Clacol_006188 [Clathrus columnatus]
MTLWLVLGVGWVTMKAVTPTPEQSYASLSPELKRQVDMTRAARLAKEKESEKLSQLTNPEADKPVWTR